MFCLSVFMNCIGFIRYTRKCLLSYHHITSSFIDNLNLKISFFNNKFSVLNPNPITYFYKKYTQTKKLFALNLIMEKKDILNINHVSTHYFAIMTLLYPFSIKYIARFLKYISKCSFKRFKLFNF